jgi:hypothetical protein
MDQPLAASFVRSLAGGELARRAVLALCGVIAARHPAAGTAMGQWTALFGQACGRNIQRPTAKVSSAVRSWNGGAAAVRPQVLLFALHTYYAILIQALVDRRLSRRGLRPNIVPGDDLFSWHIAAATPDLEEVRRTVSARVADCDDALLSPGGGYRGDLLRDLYQELLPRPLRHELGEYYTPDWLAEHVLDQVGYTGDPRLRLLDPACGSGTFLLAAVRRIRAWCETHCGRGGQAGGGGRGGQSRSPRGENWDGPQTELGRMILANIVGCDINPVAVLAARANYLLALGDLLPPVGSAAPPVVLCDSILDAPAAALAAPFDFVVGNPPWIAWDNLPADYRRATLPLWERYGLFSLSATAARHGGGKKDLAVLMICAAADRYLRPCGAADPAKESGGRRRESGVRSQESGDRSTEYEVRSTERGQSEIINRESQISPAPSPEPRAPRAALPLPGAGETHASQPTGGRLGMVLTQTAFQTKGAGDGFRRFRLGPDGEPLRVLRVDDMAAIKPFPEAANWTATLVLEKGAATQYPVPYFKWVKTGTDDVSIVRHAAEPIESARPGSPWFVRPPGLKAVVAALVGPSDYTAHLGANSGGANGVYWLQVIEKSVGGVRVRNLADKNHRGVPQVERVIEPDLLYPLLRWGDVAPFAARPSAAILLAQDCTTRTGIDPAKMQQRCPQTLAYLRQFESLLTARAAYRRYQDRKPFYSMYNVGPYTAAPVKVVWRRMDRRMRAAVVEEADDPLLGRRPVIPQETCVLIAVDSAAEAHYVCAVINSSVVGFLVAAHSVGGGKGFGTPSILDYVRLRRFDPCDRRHASLASLSQAAHAVAASRPSERQRAAALGQQLHCRPEKPSKRGGITTAAPTGNSTTATATDVNELADLQSAIDRLAAELWNLDAGDCAAIGAEMGR